MRSTVGKVYDALLRAEADRFGSGARGVEVADLEAPDEIRWEGAIFERVTSIERQLAALDESLTKRGPEFEDRLLHLLEVRLRSLEGGVLHRLSDLASALDLEGDRTRASLRFLALAIVAVALVVLIF
jgi:hypothetical protein